jgi:hypothetical protein
LSRAEFERRYQAHAEIKKAELIEGVVYMPTPVRFEQHGRPNFLREGVYETLEPDANGVLRSEVFPELWLQSAALWSGDLAAMLAVLQEGLDSPEHADFLTRLRA